VSNAVEPFYNVLACEKGLDPDTTRAPPISSLPSQLPRRGRGYLVRQHWYPATGITAAR